MLNQAPEGNEKQITAATAESAALTAISEKAAFLAPLVDVQAGEDKSGELKGETSFLGEFLRLAGGTAGFLMGGPAGAAFGSTLGELAGEIAAERTSMIWPTLGRAFLYPKRAGMKKIVLIVMAMSAAFPAASVHWAAAADL
jgi:hypothetical protein